MVLIVPDCFLVAIKGQSGGQDIVNVVGIKAPGISADAVAGAVLGAWKTTSGPLTLLTNAYQLIEVKAMSLSSADGAVYAAAATGTGQAAGSLSTNAACALVTYGAGTRSKSTKGRMYFGPLTENAVNTDGRTLANAASFTTAFTNFKNALNNANYQWGIVSRKNSSFSPIVSINTQPIIATQRRRIR